MAKLLTITEFSDKKKAGLKCGNYRLRVNIDVFVGSQKYVH